MNLFDKLPNEKLYEICELQDYRSLINFSIAYPRIRHVCSRLIEQYQYNVDLTACFEVTGLSSDFELAFGGEYNMIIFCLTNIRGSCSWYVGNVDDKGIFIGEEHDNYGEASFSYMRAKLPKYSLISPISFSYSNSVHPDEEDYICFNISQIKSYKGNLDNVQLSYDDFVKKIEPTLQRFGINYLDKDFNRQEFEPLTEHEVIWGISEKPLNYEVFNYGDFEQQDDNKYTVNF